MESLRIGKMTLDKGGCLRIGDEDGALVLWRNGFTLNVGNEKIEVLDEDGQVVARVGEEVRMGGGEALPERLKAIPGLDDTGCASPYWALGEIEPLDSTTQ